MRFCFFTLEFKDIEFKDIVQNKIIAMTVAIYYVILYYEISDTVFSVVHRLRHSWKIINLKTYIHNNRKLTWNKKITLFYYNFVLEKFCINLLVTFRALVHKAFYMHIYYKILVYKKFKSVEGNIIIIGRKFQYLEIRMIDLFKR